MLQAVWTYIVNFAAIFASMALFFSPFVAVFAWQNRQQIIAKKPHFNQFMERFFTSRSSDWLIFTWAAAEAIVWFIIPEFLLILIMFMRVQRKRNLITHDLAGTIVGTLIALIWHIPEKTLLAIPYIRPHMLEQVQSWYSSHGILGLAYQPFSGVPYKVFTNLAVDQHFFWPLFIAIAVIARMFRYVIIYQATKGIYPLVHKVVQKHYAILFVAAVAVFTAMLLNVVRIYS